MDTRNKYIGIAQNLDLYGITIKSTNKHYFTDVENKTYLDFLSSASSLPLGYNNDRLLNTYVKQAEKVIHTCTVYTFTEIVGKYAQKLSELSKIDGAKVMFGCTGSDSIDAALKCAQTYTGKPKFISFKSAYHGGTFLSLASNGFDGMKKNLELPDLFYHLLYPTKDNYEKTLYEIENILKKGEVGALLMETILGDGGVLEADIIFYKEIKELLHKYSAILILDEVQTGIGRTGTFWAYEQYGIKPDLFVAGKGLGGGYVPLSACIGKSEIIDSLNNCQNAFTFCGHAASCAVGNELIDIIKEEKLLKNVSEISIDTRKIIQEKLKDLKIFKEVRGKGLMIGIALNHKSSIGPYIGKICLEKGVYVGYYGANNNVIRIQPHINIDKNTFFKGINVVIEAIKEFGNNEKNYIKGKFKSFFTE